MRLGQLARKLEVRPMEIVDFLTTQNINIDNGTNTRMDPDHVALAIEHFSPGSDLKETVKEVEEQEEETNIEIVIETAVAAQPEIRDEVPVEKGDVIKAPKIELSGLKVLGKIDLPESRKKEPEPAAESTGPEMEVKKGRKSQEYRRRSAKNPIALQREQEALDASKKREEERNLQKERRTQNYLKKVKAPQPTKAARIFKEETQQISASDLHEPPKTLWAKFVRWLTT
jgi:hypothetical protein